MPMIFFADRNYRIGALRSNLVVNVRTLSLITFAAIFAGSETHGYVKFGSLDDL